MKYFKKVAVFLVTFTVGFSSMEGVFAKDADDYLTMEYYGGDKEKIIFYMDVQTGNILESDKNGKDEIYYLQSTLRDWYNDMREKLLEGYQNGKFTILPEWDEQG